MSSNVAPMPERQLRLPSFEGHRIPRARLAFGGAFELDLVDAEDVALVQALKLGAEATVTVAVDGLERELVLGARVVRRAHRFRKREDSEEAITDYRISVNNRAAGDDAAE